MDLIPISIHSQAATRQEFSKSPKQESFSSEDSKMV